MTPVWGFQILNEVKFIFLSSPWRESMTPFSDFWLLISARYQFTNLLNFGAKKASYSSSSSTFLPEFLDSELLDWLFDSWLKRSFILFFKSVALSFISPDFCFQFEDRFVREVGCEIKSFGPYMCFQSDVDNSVVGDIVMLVTLW